MRSEGAGPDAGAHVCTIVHGAAEFDDVAARFLAPADRSGERTVVLDREQASAFYGDRHRRDPQGLVAEFEALARQAVDQGATGLRVVVDATSMVTTPADRAAFARVEHLADRMIRANGHIRGMCCYDAEVIGDVAAAELAVLHETTSPNDTAFHLCASAHGDALRLDGELDLATRPVLERALGAVAPGSGPAVRLDVSHLDFADVASLRTLDDAAMSSGNDFLLVGAPPLLRRVMRVSGFEHLRLEAAR